MSEKIGSENGGIEENEVNEKMRKNIVSMMFGIFTVLICFSYPVWAADVSVSRNMPSRVDPQGTLSVSFTITPTETLSNFDFAELVPHTWSISDWSVSGYDESNIEFDTQESQAFLGTTYTGYHWKFNANLTSAVTLSYNLDVPVSSGSYNFIGIATYPGGFEKYESSLDVAVAPTTTTTQPTPTTTTAPPVTTTVTRPPVVLPTEWTSYVLVGIIILAAIIVLWKSGLLGSKQKVGGSHKA